MQIPGSCRLTPYQHTIYALWWNDVWERVAFRSSWLPNRNKRILFGIIQDITERKRTEPELERLAQTDPMTSLTNRRHFMLLAEQELSRTLRYGRPLSVLMLDIDHFKRVNDSYGHATGDRVIQTLA